MIILSQAEPYINQFHNFLENLGLAGQHYDSLRSFEDSREFCRTGIEKYRGLFAEEPDVARSFGESQTCFIPEQLTDLTRFSGFYTTLSLVSLGELSIVEAREVLDLFLSGLDIVAEYVEDNEENIQLFDVVANEQSIGSLYQTGSLVGFEIVAEGLAILKGAQIDVHDIYTTAYRALLREGVYPSNRGSGIAFRELIRQMIIHGVQVDNKYYVEEIRRLKSKKQRYEALGENHPKKIKDLEWVQKSTGITPQDIEIFEAIDNIHE